MNYREIIEDKMKAKRNELFPAETSDEIIDEFSGNYFGLENLRNSSSCLDLRLRDGSCFGIPYIQMPSFFYDPSLGIHITTQNLSILIKGRNLLQLYRYLVLYRVTYIQMHLGSDFEDSKTLIVTDIEIKET